jgi:hypothetical protein
MSGPSVKQCRTARIPLVQEKRLVESRGEAELKVERTALLGGR